MSDIDNTDKDAGCLEGVILEADLSMLSPRNWVWKALPSRHGSQLHSMRGAILRFIAASTNSRASGYSTTPRECSAVMAFNASIAAAGSLRVYSARNDSVRSFATRSRDGSRGSTS